MIANFRLRYNPQEGNDFYLVSLKVYDLSGREIETLVSLFKKPGIYIYNYNVKGLSGGPGFYSTCKNGFINKLGHPKKPIGENYFRDTAGVFLSLAEPKYVFQTRLRISEFGCTTLKRHSENDCRYGAFQTNNHLLRKGGMGLRISASTDLAGQTDLQTKSTNNICQPASIKKRGIIMKVSLILFMTALFSISCGINPDSHKTFLQTAPPKETGMNPEKLAELVSDVKIGKIKNIHGLLVIKDDKLVVEDYFGGYKRDDLHYSASVTKSFASALLGIAIDRGYFSGDIQTVLNRSVKDLFPEYAKVIDKDSLKSGLKLKHLLSMTAGFEWDEHTFPYTDRRNDCNKINNSREPMRFLFERKLVHRPGEEFYYNGGLSLSISYLIEKYTGMSVLKFAEKYLFKPMDIKDFRWDEVANGLIDTDGGLHLKPLDQAKLGYLFLNKGRWGGRQLVSEVWVNASTKMHVDNTDRPDYGYQWWGGDFQSQDTTWRTFFASGHGGQKVIVFPDYNLIVVIVQQVFDNPLGHLNFIAIIDNYIVPALSGRRIEESAISLTAAELSKYVGRYFSENRSEFIDVESDGGKLIVSSSNGDRNEFYPVDEQTFKARILNLITVRVKFGFDEKGRATTLQSKFGYRNLQFVKDAAEKNVRS